MLQVSLTLADNRGSCSSNKKTYTLCRIGSGVCVTYKAYVDISESYATKPNSGDARAQCARACSTAYCAC